MANSARFKALQQRVGELRKVLLPAKFSKTGQYTNVELDLARSYRLLVHAEIEAYLEERALELARLSLALWHKKTKASRTLLALIANLKGDRKGLAKQIGERKSVDIYSSDGFAQYNHGVKNNHGVRIENIFILLLPIGIKEDDLDNAWLLTIDGFGLLRGAAAHTSAVSYNIDPKSDYDTVAIVMEGVKSVDLMLNKLRKELT